MELRKRKKKLVAEENRTLRTISVCKSKLKFVVSEKSERSKRSILQISICNVLRSCISSDCLSKLVLSETLLFVRKVIGTHKIVLFLLCLKFMDDTIIIANLNIK